MSISKIYKIGRTQHLYKNWSRKGKTKELIEKMKSGRKMFAGEVKAMKANSKMRLGVAELKTQSQEEMKRKICQKKT